MKILLYLFTNGREEKLITNAEFFKKSFYQGQNQTLANVCQT